MYLCISITVAIGEGAPVTGLHSSRHAPFMHCVSGWHHASPSLVPCHFVLQSSALTIMWVWADFPVLLTQEAVAIEGCLASGASTFHALLGVTPILSMHEGCSTTVAEGAPRQMAAYVFDIVRLRNCSCMAETTRGSFANSIIPVVSISSLCSTCMLVEPAPLKRGSVLADTGRFQTWP